MSRLPFAALGAVCAATVLLTACAPSTPGESAPAAPGTPPASASAPTVSTATPPAIATSPAAGTCASVSHPASSAHPGSPAGSITVCPGRAAVGDVVRITIQGCDTASRPAAALVFLGSGSFVGSGGGGVQIPLSPASGGRATATFTVPAGYTGGEHGSAPNPALPVKPGSTYSFATYPSGVCSAPFTVTSGAS